jgi:hypothetical protein
MVLVITSAGRAAQGRLGRPHVDEAMEGVREAVSLMGGYGITEDCPGFLGQKWMDAHPVLI